jgi:hypothetical protein
VSLASRCDDSVHVLLSLPIICKSHSLTTKKKRMNKDKNIFKKIALLACCQFVSKHSKRDFLRTN